MNLSNKSILTLLLLATPANAQQFFRDVTATSGVQYLHNTAGSPGSGGVLAMSAGAAAGDVDGDGWVDIFVTCLNKGSRLFRNLGEDLSGTHLGFQNVAATAFHGGPGVRRLNGASFADVDGDGDLDLLATGIFTPHHFLWINDGAGHFSEEGATRGLNLPGSPAHRGYSSSFGDYDGDGYLDLYVTEWGHVIQSAPPTPSNSRLLRNLGAANPGYFEDTTLAAGVAVEDSIPTSPNGNSWQGVYTFTPQFADFDNDGWPDLAITGDFSTSRLFWNNGDGTFSDGTLAAQVAGDENGMGATVGDFDGDGNLDWFVTSIFDPLNVCATSNCNWGGTGNRLYLGDGARNFTDATSSGVREGGWGWGTTGIDYDNDGRLDIVMTNGIDFSGTNIDRAFNHDASKLWKQTASGFVDVSVAAGIRDRKSGKGLFKFDYDRDGDQDLFIANANDGPVLYRNELGNTNQWLQLELDSTGPNTRAIGARVRLWPNASDAPLVREQSASSNYLSQNETLLHFGLGADNVVSRLEVNWPNGTQTILLDVPAGQRLHLIEP
jgi:hypothetical protein